jgi:hypothetical protein
VSLGDIYTLSEFQVNIVLVVLVLCCGCCVFGMVTNDWCTCCDPASAEADKKKRQEEERMKASHGRMSRASRESWDETMGPTPAKGKGKKGDPMKTLVRQPSGKKHRASPQLHAAAQNAKKGLKKKQSMELMEFGVSLETEAVKVKVPKGAKPGTEVTFSLPGGRSTTIVLPRHATPGMVLEVQVSKINTGTSM